MRTSGADEKGEASLATFQDQYCLRVAALAFEIAGRLGLPRDDCRALRALGMLASSEHKPRETGMDRLIDDVMQAYAAGAAPAADDPLVAVAEVARAFNLGLEYAAYEYRTPAEILAELRELAAAGHLDSAAVAALESLRVPPEVLANLPGLHAYPKVLVKALALVRDDNVSFAGIEQLINTDQVLASSLLRLANSALYSPRTPITTVARGIAAVGLDAVRRILIAAGAKPLFASAALRDLWRHSIEVATIMERLADSSGFPDPAVAFVAGLIHDIGRVKLESLPGDAAASYRRLATECPVLADAVLVGEDHGHLGASILRQWGLPAALVEAVEYHHRPELKVSSLAPLTYLAEFASESDEDLPSSGRLRIAMQAAKIDSLRILSEARADERPEIDALAMAV